MSSLFFTITLILVNPVAIMCHSPCLLTEFVIKKFSSTEDAAFVILLSGFRYGAVEPLVEAWDGLAFFFSLRSIIIYNFRSVFSTSVSMNSYAFMMFSQIIRSCLLGSSMHFWGKLCPVSMAEALFKCGGRGVSSIESPIGPVGCALIWNVSSRPVKFQRGQSLNLGSANRRRSGFWLTGGFVSFFEENWRERMIVNTEVIKPGLLFLLDLLVFNFFCKFQHSFLALFLLISLKHFSYLYIFSVS